ncbi:unnamed protein product [Linum trigynum]|uniref:Uncharacterized protein n=1 Tax=Linum trigynum TaxID=586398 RepID=A0AAV2DE74_9ROSI
MSPSSSPSNTSLSSLKHELVDFSVKHESVVPEAIILKTLVRSSYPSSVVAVRVRPLSPSSLFELSINKALHY